MPKSAPSSATMSSIRWPGPLARMAPAQRNMSLALGVSLLFHAILLSIHFGLPDALRNASERTLDVILVNSKSASKPIDAQAKAQVDLDGGGNTPEDRRATSPLPPSKQDREGTDLVEAHRRVVELEALQKKLLTQTKSTQKIAVPKGSHDPLPKIPTELSGLDLANSTLANIANLEAEIGRSQSAVNKHPIRKVLAVRTKSVPEAMYVNAVLEKIERVGTLNFPAAARNNSYGQLLVTLVINPDGTLFSFELDQPSDTKVLNAAARKIAELASPFPRVPAEILTGMNVVSITRWWSFTNEDFRTAAPK